MGTEVRVENGKVCTGVWKVVGRHSVTEDHFPDQPGPAADDDTDLAPPASVPAVLRYNNPYAPDAAGATFVKLYPGDPSRHLDKVNEAGAADGGAWTEVSLSEWWVFITLLIASSVFIENGKELWNSVSTGFKTAANFSQYMSLRRFEQIKKYAKYAFADMDAVAKGDLWGWLREGIRDFNANRKRWVVQSPVKTGDESMSAWRPRTTATGGLPNITFLVRKPEPLGTEFKDVCDGTHGVMLYLEIQEGRDGMRIKPVNGAKVGENLTVGVQSACAVRIAVGSL